MIIIIVSYLPPEMVYVDDLGIPHVKTFGVNETTGEPITAGLPYDLVVASEAHDSWSFGATLFHLCSGESLFHSNSDDNIDRKQLLQLYHCSDDWLEEKLDKIDDDLAR